MTEESVRGMYRDLANDVMNRVDVVNEMGDLLDLAELMERHQITVAEEELLEAELTSSSKAPAV